MIISVDGEKASDKLWHPFMIKTQQSWYSGSISQHNKGHLRQTQGFPGGSVVKDPPAKQETWVWSLVWEDPMKKEMPTHPSILARQATVHEHKELDMT